MPLEPSQGRRPAALVRRTVLCEDAAMTMAHIGLLALLAAPAGPERVLVSPDGARRVVIESPQGEATWRYGLHPQERTAARVEDAGSGRLIARPALGWSVVGAVIGPDSRTLTVLCLGYRSQHAREALPREVAIFDLETGAERGRVPLPYRVPELADPSATGKVFDLLSVGTADGTFETVTLHAPTTFDLVLSRDVAFVLARPQGKRLWNTEPPTRLTILHQGRPAWSLELPPQIRPARLSADGRRLALEGLGLFVLVDLEAGRVVRRENGRRRFKTDVTLDAFLAGEPGFGLAAAAPPPPDPAPWSARAENPYCPWVGGLPRGVAP
jgi:hypothetical protein